MTSLNHWDSGQWMPRSPDVRWRRIGTLMLAVVAALTLAACGATHSGQKSTSTTSTATVPPTTATAAATTTTQAPTDATALPGYLADPDEPGGVHRVHSLRGRDLRDRAVRLPVLGRLPDRDVNGPIDGKISGSSVTINDENNVITTSGSVSGTFQGSDLVLAFPQQNGQLAPVQFSPPASLTTTTH